MIKFDMSVSDQKPGFADSAFDTHRYQHYKPVTCNCRYRDQSGDVRDLAKIRKARTGYFRLPGCFGDNHIISHSQRVVFKLCVPGGIVAQVPVGVLGLGQHAMPPLTSLDCLCGLYMGQSTHTHTQTFLPGASLMGLSTRTKKLSPNLLSKLSFGHQRHAAIGRTRPVCHVRGLSQRRHGLRLPEIA